MRYAGAMNRVALILLAAAVGFGGGCSSSGDPTVQIAGGSYSDAFEATRESLRDFDFRLDRVDAASGVITSAIKPTSGLATPWDPEQSGIDQEWEDFINRQRRTVRVEFTPQNGEETPAGPRDPAAAKAPPLVDLRDFQGPVIATVSVTVERVQRPGWQVNTKSVNNSTFTMDPALAAAGKYPTYVVELEPDARLARRIADRIRRIMAQPRREEPQAPPQQTNESAAPATTAP